MLAKANRLKKEKDFTRIYKKGNRENTKNLRITYLKTGQNVPRFGFVVSKKQAAKTVERNRIKRRLRAMTARLLEKIDPRYDVVISGNIRVLGLTDEELENELTLLLKKAKILFR